MLICKIINNVELPLGRKCIGFGRSKWTCGLENPPARLRDIALISLLGPTIFALIDGNFGQSGVESDLVLIRVYCVRFDLFYDIGDAVAGLTDANHIALELVFTDLCYDLK